MSKKIFVKNKEITLRDKQYLAQGGEAEIYRINDKLVAKVFKEPEHRSFLNDKLAQAGAKIRLKEIQSKLPAFPRNLPPEVISPVELIKNKNGNIIGYLMPFIKDAEVLYQYSQKKFCLGIPEESVIEIFKNIHRVKKEIHKAGVVIGDDNDLNFLIINSHGKIKTYFIDADSYQFGKFVCHMFTMRFVDPLLCNPKNSSGMELIKQHNPMSDWYAYNIMLFQCLLYVGPYGGVYKPKDKKKAVLHDARPLKRITVFDDDVIYPKPAKHWKILSDEILQYFHMVFKRDKREEFPVKLIEDRAWKRPDHVPAPAAVTAVVVIRGKVKSTRIFRTDGIIVKSEFQDGKLRYLYNERGKFFRENGDVVCPGEVEQNLRFGIQGKKTIIGKRSTVLSIEGSKTETYYADKFGNVSSFDTNSKNLFWIQDGDLKQDDKFGSKFIGSVLPGQTMFWVGETFGFGFYRAGEMNVGFVFNPGVKGINDSVNLPPISGALIDGSCYFTSKYAWFLYTVEEKNKTKNYCLVIDNTGKTIAKAEADKDDESWLGGIKGKFVSGEFVLSPTDEGIVRAEISGEAILETKKFPDTEPFVSRETRIFPGSKGLHAVNLREIFELNIS